MSEQLYFIVMKQPRSDYALFWRPERCGYTYRIDDAGRYTEEEAKNICRIRGEEVMVPCEQIERIAVRVVDHRAAMEGLL